jgi:cytochrome c553
MKTAFSVTLALALASQAVFAQAPATPAAPAAAPASAAASASAPAPAPAAASAPAAAPAAAAPDMARGGQIAAQVCAACHSADGNSTIATNPKLAGQHAEYLVRQLNAFKANADRKNPIMLGFASALTPADMANVAAYFSEQKPKDGTARNPATVKMGEKIYRGGIADKAVPACAGCHGPAGAGIPAQYPRLGGQWADYTKAQLAAFRTGDRKNDNAGAMRGIAQRLSDKEIEAVADYISGLKRAN